MSHLFYERMQAGIAAGIIELPALYQAVPPTYEGCVRDGVEYAVFMAWGHIHGLLMLEVTHHLVFMGDAATFYEQSTRHFYQALGIQI